MIYRMSLITHLPAIANSAQVVNLTTSHSFLDTSSHIMRKHPNRDLFEAARGSFCKDWHIAATPAGRKFPPIEPDPNAQPLDYENAIRRWIDLRREVYFRLEDRELHFGSEEINGKTLVVIYVRRTDPDSKKSEREHWIRVWHGTNWYGITNIVAYGGPLISVDPTKGHELLDGKPGVYATPSYEAAWRYATPHRLFDTDRWLRVV